MNPNPVRCYCTDIKLAEEHVKIEGFVEYPEYNEPPCLFTVYIRKVTWDDFQPSMDEWKSHTGLACTFVSKDAVYITDVHFQYDTEKVVELRRGPSIEIEEYTLFECEKKHMGLPAIVYCHLIGHLKTRLSPSQ